MQQQKPLVILGSARGDGDTRKLIDMVFGDSPYDMVDLLDYQIAPYNYREIYTEEDQFLEVANRLYEYSAIVFATPVYWYAMSGQMKIFFDRITDLLHTKEELRAKLKGKKIFVLAVSASPQLPEGFEYPFAETATYLNMEFGGSYFSPCYHLDNPPPGMEEFLQNVNQSVLV